MDKSQQRSLCASPTVANFQSRAFTTKQAYAAGVTKRQVAYRLHKGIWQRVAGDALRHRDDPVTPQMLAFAAHLTWPDSVLCGPNVVAVLGVPIRDLDHVHVIVPTPRKARLRIAPHEFKLDAEDCRDWNGIRMTSFNRALMDALVLLPPRSAQSLFVWMSAKSRLTASDIEVYLAKSSGRWGNSKLKRFLIDARAGVMSAAEGRTQELLRQAGITGWQANVAVRDEQGIIARADILFPKQCVVIEIDGREFHGTDRFQMDRTRGNLLISAGYRVLHFTWEDLTRRPRMVVDQIQTILAV